MQFFMHLAFFTQHNMVTLVVFNQQAEAVAMEGEEYWPSGQFEPGRAAVGRNTN